MTRTLGSLGTVVILAAVVAASAQPVPPTPADRPHARRVVVRKPKAPMIKGHTRLHEVDYMFSGVWLAAEPTRDIGGLHVKPLDRPSNRLVHEAGWEAFTKVWGDFAKDSWRLIDIEATPLGDVTMYSGVFEPGSDRYGLISLSDWNAFTKHWTDSLGQGLHMIDIEILKEGETTYFIAVYRDGRTGQHLWRTFDWTDFTRRFGELHAQGFRLIDVESDTAAGRRAWTGVWSSGQGGEYFYGLSGWKAFTDKWEELAKKGYRLFDMESYEDGADMAYLGVWREGSTGYGLWSGGNLNAFRKVSTGFEKDEIRLVDFEAEPMFGLRTTTAWIPGYASPQTIRYRETRDGRPVIEGDMIIDPNWKPASAVPRPGIGQPAGGVGQQEQALASTLTDYLWPLGLIPVEVSEKFNPDECMSIARALADLDQQTDLTFFPRTHEPNYLSFQMEEDGRCHTDVGMADGERKIFLTPPLLDPDGGCLSRPAVQHETLHAAGFHHEHIRPDRDTYLQVNWDNIEDGKRGNFKIKRDEIVVGRTEYDYRSIMHYAANAFGIPMGNPPAAATTLVPKQPGVALHVDGDGDDDQRTLSPLDIEGVNSTYALMIPDPSLVRSGAPTIAETTFDACGATRVVVDGRLVLKGALPGIVFRPPSHEFSWTCGDETESTTCHPATTHVAARRNEDGYIRWDCLVAAPAPGARFIDTEIDRCRQERLEVERYDGQKVAIRNLSPQPVEVASRQIRWWCDGDLGHATLPPGTRHVQVDWNRSADGRIRWHAFTAAHGLCPPR